MATIRVKIIDSTQPKPWFASAWCKPNQKPEQKVAELNRLAKQVRHIGKVTYELATEEQYQQYRKSSQEML